MTLPVVYREVDSPTNVFCLYCARQLVVMPGPDERGASGDCGEPCEHVLFMAMTDLDFMHVGEWCKARLQEAGFETAVHSEGVEVVPPAPEGTDPDDDEWLWELDFNDKVDLVLEAIGDLDDGVVIQDCYPALSGGGALWIALRGPGR